MSARAGWLALVLVACGSPPTTAPTAITTTTTTTTATTTTAPPTTATTTPAATAALTPTPTTAPAPATATVAEPPLPPEPTAPIACAELGVAVYDGSLTGDVLHLTALLSGEADEDHPLPFAVRGEPVDLDGDGTNDMVGTWQDPDGEADCGNWGECVMGAYVHCDGGWAVVSPLDYALDLRAGTTRTEHAGRRFRVLIEPTRLGDADPEHDAEGHSPTYVLPMTAHGYHGGGRDPWFESEQCAAFVTAQELVRARDMCEQGLAAHPRGPVRGALYFDLGRVAEAEGRTADAREAYRLSLEARPGNAVVEARLAALGD